MIKLLYVDPTGTGMFDRYFYSLLNREASPDVQVDVVHLTLPEEPSGPFIPSLPAYQGELFRAISRAEENGYQAVIVGCCSDPGYRSGKRATSVPVVFPLEAGLHLAAMLAERISVITPGPLSEVAWIEDSARHYGLDRKIVSIHLAEVPYPSPAEITQMMAEDAEQLAEAILEAHRQSIDVDVLTKALSAVNHEGAGALFLACTFWGGTAITLERQIGVPVLDPCLAPLWLAEILARRGR